MNITDDLLVWTADDEGKWAFFLSSPTGQRLLPKIVESAPLLLESGDSNAVLIRNGKLLGFQAAVKAMLDLSHSAPLPKREPDAFPSLTDDSQWNDGEKLNP